jgi:hypothetical protein
MSGSAFINPTFLIDYSQPSPFSDYRCVVNPTATVVLFERRTRQQTGVDPITYGPFGPDVLYCLNLGQNGLPSGEPETFLAGSGLPSWSNRPDWCWRPGPGQTNVVAFNGPYNGVLSVFVVGSDGVNPTQLGQTATETMDYPAWFPGGAALAVMNLSKSVSPRPNTSTIDPSNGALIASALTGESMWAGMPSVNPTNSKQIVFAGQLAQSSGSYNQDFNYIWLLDLSTSPPTLAPLENGAPSSGPFNPNWQGRAPWWSPDGKWVVFESNRPPPSGIAPPPLGTPTGLYSIYLYQVGGSGPAIQITDPNYNCNHAKWYPNGFAGYPPGDVTLIVAAKQVSATVNPHAPYGLASLNLSSLDLNF